MRVECHVKAHFVYKNFEKLLRFYHLKEGVIRVVSKVSDVQVLDRPPLDIKVLRHIDLGNVSKREVKWLCIDLFEEFLSEFLSVVNQFLADRNIHARAREMVGLNDLPKRDR